jgi:alkylresorcinol/alkylpyrone synthase
VAFLWSIATALPPHTIDAAGTREVGRRLFGDLFAGNFEPYDSLIDNSRIDRRYLVRPVDDLIRSRGLRESSQWYSEAVRELGVRVLRDALERAQVRPDEVDAIVVSASTGFMIPSLDAYLINECGLRPSTRRVPFSTLGCAGGAGGVLRSAELLRGRGEDATIAFVTVETPTLTFRRGDISMANAISSVLFGDGAAAVILRGRPPARASRREGPCLRVKNGGSWLQKDTYGAMGFVLGDDGYQVILSPDVPERAAHELPDRIDELCRAGGATRSDLRFFAIHPGGARVLERVSTSLRLGDTATSASWGVYRDHGNMSGPTVLFVLDRILRDAPPDPGSLGLLIAFGPGFSAEMALLEAVA